MLCMLLTGQKLMSSTAHGLQCYTVPLLDSCTKELKATGNYEVKQAESITGDFEDLLWQKV